MIKQLIRNERTGESYYRIDHPTGLTMLLYPMEGYSSSYAMLGAKYGSIDESFKKSNEDDYLTVPAGIAHFLEHKLFESEDGDAFEKYAKTGASANAFTSFDKTCYLFSCTDHFNESLEILLGFVTAPYFTQKTVEKEQGIIGQEIRMYDDDPEWRVFFNLLCAMYQKHPVKIDIAGTVDSIAKIDEKLLYRCYDTFYNLNNMVLSIAGNFSVDDVVAIADRILKKSEPVTVDRLNPEEPRDVFQREVEMHLPVSMPMFHIGFKELPVEDSMLLKTQIATEIILDIMSSDVSQLYRRLYDGGLINAEFASEVASGNGYLCTVFSGESKDPRKVYSELLEELKQVKNSGIPAEDFERSKKSFYGKCVGSFNSVSSVSSGMIMSAFAGYGFFDSIETVANMDLGFVNEVLQSQFREEYSSISIVWPTKE